MINSNVCPIVFIAEETEDPKKFETSHINEIKKIKELCEAHCKSTKILKETVKRYRNNLPWNKVNDVVWRKYLEDWKSFIYPFLDKCMTSVNVEGEVQPCLCLAHLTEKENVAWVFLNTNHEKLAPDGPVTVIGPKSDCNNEDCDSVTAINFEEKVRFINYPWLATYDTRLPSSGECPFIPPKNWQKFGVILKGGKNGWIDIQGREWVPDTERKDHWDVQLKNQGHLNVNYDGNIIS